MTQPSAVGNVTENSTDFMLAPGETSVYGDRFLISIIAPYLKGQMMCSTTRFVFKVPNTLLGVIPVGSNENTIPISAIAAVSTSSKLRVGRAILALIFILAGLSTMGSTHGTGSTIFWGIVMTLLGISFAATCMPMVLTVQNHAGGATALEVAIFERSKLERFRQELQNRVFADMSQIRHDQAMDQRMQLHQQNMNMQQQNMNIQQMQLQQMQMQNQQAQQMHQQYMQPQIPQPAPQQVQPNQQQVPQPTQPLPQPNQQQYGYQQGQQ